MSDARLRDLERHYQREGKDAFVISKEEYRHAMREVKQAAVNCLLVAEMSSTTNAERFYLGKRQGLLAALSCMEVLVYGPGRA